MSKTVFLWDIDGTLLLTGGAGVVAFNRVFEEIYHEQYIWEGVHPDGKTDDRIIGELFRHRFKRDPSPSELQKIATRYNELMIEEVPKSPQFRLMPCAAEVLKTLHERDDVLQGLATGNYKPAAYAKLQKGAMDYYFTFGGFGCDSADRQTLTSRALERAKEKLQSSPKKLFLVGDTIHDVSCGKGIGAITVAVCTGSTKRDELEAAGADFVLDDLSQFHKVFS